MYRNLRVVEQVQLAALPPCTLMNTLFSRLLRSKRNSLQELAKKALGEFRLAHMADEPVNNLSGGQARRLTLASARVRYEVGHLRLMLMDEPFSGIDDGGKESVRTLVEDLRRSGCAVLVAEHVGEMDTSLGSRVLRLLPIEGTAN